MKNVKLLRLWHNSTVTEVTVGQDVKLCTIAKSADEEDNCRYIIDKIDEERLEVTLRLNSLGSNQYTVLGRNDLAEGYAFFAQI